jgi:hypothetical protein
MMEKRDGGADEAWMIACYREAIGDIRWAKERASSVTHWSVLLSGGIVIGVRAASLPLKVGALLSVMQGAIAVLWLLELNRFAKRAREWVHGGILPAGGYPVKQKDDPDHSIYLAAHLVVVLVGVALAIAALA